MAYDIEWLGLVDMHINTGSTESLRKLIDKIRTDGVPKEFGNEIADMLAGNLKPDYASAKLKSYKQKQFYDNFLSYRKQIKEFEAMTYKAYKPMIDAGLMPNPIKASSVSKTALHKAYAKEFCQGKTDNARRIINRKIAVGEWPQFPD